MKSIKYLVLQYALISFYVHTLKLRTWPDISSLCNARIIQSFFICSFKARSRCSYRQPPLLLTRLLCCQPTSHTNRASLVSQNM